MTLARSGLHFLFCLFVCFQLVRENDPPQCVKKSMYFWTHTELESDSKNSHSKFNEEEAKEITKVAEAFCGEGQVSPSGITVLCSYRGQASLHCGSNNDVLGMRMIS